jgi:hypothetical protein
MIFKILINAYIIYFKDTNNSYTKAGIVALGTLCYTQYIRIIYCINGFDLRRTALTFLLNDRNKLSLIQIILKFEL